MGNSVAKLTLCFSGGGGGLAAPRRRIGTSAVGSDPFDEGLGHSFCYLSNPNPSNSKPYSISGAAVSANASTALTTALPYDSDAVSAASRFDSSTSFSSHPLHPIPRFPSGPIDRGFLSGPLDPRSSNLSGPLDPRSCNLSGPLKRSFSSHGGARLIRSISNKISNKISRTISCPNPKISKLDDQIVDSLQWAHGKAGEDRVHVVVSEDDGSIFVGIYDGFNGPDATDYLLSNLYNEVRIEMKEADSTEGEHLEVLKALDRSLRKTEDGFFEVADSMGMENPELGLMGSCVLVMVMRGEDVYLMNVGDSRAVLGQEREKKDRYNRRDLEGVFQERFDALQLTSEHSTCVDKEVRRIRNEHPDDACALMNDRVKGSLKVTRAFGAGFLKQPKWNDALLEMFRIDYVGTSPYITCNPFLYHHRLGPKDRFLILSSDGLYQYFTNEEAVAEVDLFITTTPEGDPAQHLVEEVIFRAAKKAGLDFYELLEIPQGDRRRYHDDVSIIVISFEGRIWRSCM